MIFVEPTIIYRDIVKVRKVAGTVVITLPRELLSHTSIEVDDRVMIEVHKDGYLVVTKEDM